MSLVLQAWIALTVVFVVGEILSPRMLLLPFGAGTAAAAFLEFQGVSNGWQWISFLCISGVILVVAQRARASKGRH